MRATRLTALVLTLAVFAACARDQATNANQSVATPAASATSLTPEQLGELGAEIRKEPGRADEILARRGLNHQSFEKAIRDVTENPEASKRYAAAYRKASA